jgi:surface protein
MELAEIRPFEPQMAEIDLFTMPDAVGVGEPSLRKVKPYISGHVTDGSSTFTFTVNGNESVTVPVDANGNWKWVADRTITSLYKAFQNITNIDSLTIVYKKDTITNLNMTFQGCSVETLDISKLNTSKVRSWGQTFNNMPNSDYSFVPHLNTESATDLFQAFLVHNLSTNRQATLDLRHIETKNVTQTGTFYGISRQVWANTVITTLHLGRFAAYSHLQGCDVLVSSAGYKNLENVTAEAIAINMDFKATAKLTEQSVVNLFNAVAADGITLTFHATVYAMIEEQLEIEGSPIYEAYWNSDYDFNYASA